MAWRQIGDKPSSEPMLTRFTTDAYTALGEDDNKYWKSIVMFKCKFEILHCILQIKLFQYK